MLLSEAANHMNGSLHGNDAEMTSVCTDTRKLQAGELFFCLDGPNFDAHNFLAEVHKGNALAAVVAKEKIELAQQVDGLNFIAVDDVLASLGLLAKSWREQFDLDVVAVTGSSGKTTVKEMIAAILSEEGQTLATSGNFNNHIGAPLTLLRLQASDRYAVIELGASGAGEIAYTSGLTQPKVALVNNVAAAHIEGFGSLQGIATAKGEIYHSLSSTGYAVVNLDDSFADYWLLNVDANRLVTFALDQEKGAHVYLMGSHCDSDGVWQLKVHTPEQDIEVQLSLLGAHNVKNALAAISCVLPLGVSVSSIQAGLAKMKPVNGRMTPYQLADNVLLVDDSYNANESSVAAAIDHLAEANANTRILVLGDLAELGAESEMIHGNLGAYAKENQIDYLLGVGEKVKASLQAFGDKGMHCSSHQIAAQECQKLINDSTRILVKGSRSSSMDKVVAELRALMSANSSNPSEGSGATN